MKCRIEIEMGNAAFDEDNAGPETARILQHIAVRMADGWMPDNAALHDINGNPVGFVTVEG